MLEAKKKGGDLAIFNYQASTIEQAEREKYYKTYQKKYEKNHQKDK